MILTSNYNNTTYNKTFIKSKTDNFSRNSSFGKANLVSDVFQQTNNNRVDETNALIKDLFVGSIDFKSFSDYLKERRIPQKDIDESQQLYKKDLESIFSNIIEGNQSLSINEVESIKNYVNAIKNTQKEVELFIYKSFLPFAIAPEMYDQMRLEINKALFAQNKEQFNLALNDLQNKGIAFSNEETSILWKYPAANLELMKQPEMVKAKNNLNKLINVSLKAFLKNNYINNINEESVLSNLLSKHLILANKKQTNPWQAFQN